MTAKNVMFSTRSHLARLRRRSLSISFAEFRLCLARGRLALLLYNKALKYSGIPMVFRISLARIRLASPVLLVGQMQSHGDLLLRLYGQARGRAAEYWQKYLESDQWVQTMGIPERAQEWRAQRLFAAI